jgi:hypothetical protein
VGNVNMCSCVEVLIILCSSLNARDPVSHPYKKKDESIVLYILIFTFLNSSRKAKYSELHDSNYSPNLVKKKVCPATCHGGTWGERRYISYSYLTSALDLGEWSASRPGRALLPGKGPPVPIVQEAGWAPEPVWTQGLEEKSSAPVGDSNPDRPGRSQTLY